MSRGTVRNRISEVEFRLPTVLQLQVSIRKASLVLGKMVYKTRIRNVLKSNKAKSVAGSYFKNVRTVDGDANIQFGS